MLFITKYQHTRGGGGWFVDVNRNTFQDKLLHVQHNCASILNVFFVEQLKFLQCMYILFFNR